MKVGALSVKEDSQRVKAAREAVGEDVKLMVDANCAYRYYDAIRLAKAIEEYDPFWFEEPVAPDDYDGMKLISQSTSIPIAAGENEYTRYGFRDLMETKAVPILNVDACVMGGITEFMKAAAMAQAYDLDVTSHGRQSVHIHLIAAIQNGLLLEYYPRQYDPIRHKTYTRSMELNANGTVSLPNVPGIAYEPDYDELEPYRVL